MSELAQAIGSQEWLDHVAKPVEKAVERAFPGDSGRNVKDALHGRWLGHPLHPVLTDIPIGAWMMAQVFDALGAARRTRAYDEAARVCITTGLVGAVGAAVTGLADWSDTGRDSRRIGFVHGMINIAATSLFLTSALLRRRRKSPNAVAASSTGFAVAMAGAYLGGALVYQRQIGPHHALEWNAPGEFTRAVPASELPEGTRKKVRVGDVDIVVGRHQGRLFALAERCAHQGGPLSEGELKDGAIVCPWHGSTFCVESGKLVHGPSVYDQPCYDVRESGGFLEVRRR
ncbi:MAG TPA: Rieske 2Fe-2S domain-containing protein [Vicinamibacterales bacterium]|nr:Rieske 2Fe-2S domain-containing protein [Vicinamibacterales bacterium]